VADTEADTLFASLDGIIPALETTKVTTMAVSPTEWEPGDLQFEVPLSRSAPPPAPIYDAHVHVSSLEETARFLEVARGYGVARALGVGFLRKLEALPSSFRRHFDYCVIIESENALRDQRFMEETRRTIERARKLGAISAKFWFSPAIYERNLGLYLSDRLLSRAFDLLGELGMSALLHLADPDSWFNHTYDDPDFFGDKLSQYEHLEIVLAEHRDVIFQCAHFAGHPEDLDHVDGLLERHPNLVIDTSATKWIARELSAQTERAREFVIRRADRTLFGSDLLMGPVHSDAHYASRYHVHQLLWETNHEGPSPIIDTDADGEVTLRGMALPAEVLRKIYYENARTWLGIQGPGAGDLGSG